MIATGSLAGLFGLAAFSMLYIPKTLFFPIALAIVLTLVFAPVVRRLNQWQIPTSIGGGLVVGGILGLLATAIVFLWEPATQWIDDAPNHFSEVKHKLRSIQEPIRKISDAGDRVSGLTEIKGEKKPLAVEVKQSGATASLLNSTREAIAVPLSTLVILYFFLAGGDRLLDKLLRLTSGQGGTAIASVRPNIRRA
ncbi:MAG: AI-2E family transporter [Thiohalocapsa sp.]